MIIGEDLWLTARIKSILRRRYILMKGKIKILGHIGLTLILLSALMLALIPAVPVAASSVSSVWMEFAAAGNNINTNALYTIHFTTGTALSRGVDTITVIFPDGTDATMGPTTTQDSYDFELGSASSSAAYYSVDPTGDPLGLGLSYVTCTADATIAGYRVKVTTPVDIPASTAATLKISASATITTPAVAASTYKIKLATSKDTSFVLSSAFPVDGTVLSAFISTANYPSSLVAGAAAAYKWTFTVAGTVAIGGTVTVQFPVGTYLPTTISTAEVYAGNGTDDPPASAVSVDTAARTVTVTTAEALTTSGQILYFTTSAGIKNKTTLGHSDVYMWTSTDGQKIGETDDDDIIVAGTATTLAFCNDVTNGYSDDATILYAFTGKLYIDSVDAYGHLKAASPTEPTIALSVVTGSGAFYTAQDTANPYSNTALSSGILGSSNAIYYRPTSAGTHTLKAEVVSGTSLTEATWTVYVAPAVVLKDANSQTIGTYGPASTSTTDATYGSTWIQAAIDAAFPGDTVELGGTALAPAIYELSTVITLNKKITLKSATGASYTTLRPTDEMDKAINVTTSGTATNPVIIDGLTFTRLRLAQEFDVAVSNGSGYDYLTVRNCTFNYIMPDASGTTEAVVWFLAGGSTITSATISSNTFTNCVGFNAISGGRTGVIQFYDTGGTAAMTGVTISGNTITNCNDYGIAIGGSGNHNYTASITNNTITNGYSPIDLNAYNTSGTVTFTVTGNTITGGYRYGIRVEGGYYASVTIKNNTITGCAGAASEGAIYIPDETDAVITVQYNDIYSNNGYAIYAAASPTGGHDCKYNWFGSATGPAYTALTGATVSKSNPNGTGDAITDKVCYFPWLHKSKADVVTDNASYQACTMKLVAGWNTLSTPVKLISTADSIDELIPSGMTIGYFYDATGWHLITTGYVLNPCDAVYVKMSAEKYVLLKFDASAFSAPSKALNAGWNLMSLAYLSSSGQTDLATVASVLKTAAGLPGYSQLISPSLNATQTNMYGVAGTSWAYSSGQTAGQGGTCYAGLGYWVYMQNAATLAGFEITPIAPDLD
jgi:hypothetical protein